MAETLPLNGLTVTWPLQSFVARLLPPVFIGKNVGSNLRFKLFLQCPERFYNGSINIGKWQSDVEKISTFTRYIRIWHDSLSYHLFLV